MKRCGWLIITLLLPTLVFALLFASCEKKEKPPIEIKSKEQKAQSEAEKSKKLVEKYRTINAAKNDQCNVNDIPVMVNDLQAENLTAEKGVSIARKLITSCFNCGNEPQLCQDADEKARAFLTKHKGELDPFTKNDKELYNDLVVLMYQLGHKMFCTMAKGGAAKWPEYVKDSTMFCTPAEKNYELYQFVSSHTTNIPVNTVRDSLKALEWLFLLCERVSPWQPPYCSDVAGKYNAFARENTQVFEKEDFNRVIDVLGKNMGKEDDSIWFASKALEKFPDDAELAKATVSFLRKNGKYEELLKLAPKIETLLKDNPNFTIALVSAEIATGDIAKANEKIAVFEKEKKVAPETIKAFKAWVLLSADKCDEAWKLIGNCKACQLSLPDEQFQKLFMGCSLKKDPKLKKKVEGKKK